MGSNSFREGIEILTSQSLFLFLSPLFGVLKIQPNPNPSDWESLISYRLGCPPSQDSCGKWRFSSGSPKCNNPGGDWNPGRGDNPSYRSKKLNSCLPSFNKNKCTSSAPLATPVFLSTNLLTKQDLSETESVLMLRIPENPTIGPKLKRNKLPVSLEHVAFQQ